MKTEDIKIKIGWLSVDADWLEDRINQILYDSRYSEEDFASDAVTVVAHALVRDIQKESAKIPE